MQFLLLNAKEMVTAVISLSIYLPQSTNGLE